VKHSRVCLSFETPFDAFDPCNATHLPGDKAAVQPGENQSGVLQPTARKEVILEDGRWLIAIACGALEVCEGLISGSEVGDLHTLYLSAGFIIEEGFAVADLEKIVVSMSEAAAEAGVVDVVGDVETLARLTAEAVKPIIIRESVN